MKTGEGFVVTAVESQNDIDYAMPWRIMRYDQMEYGRQLKELRRGKQAKRSAAGLRRSKWAERLGKEDRLAPVYTICFYHGTEKWDGPRSLKDMMRFPEGNIWRQCFQNYGMVLYCANEPGNLERFGTELRQLLKVLPLRKDKKALAGLWQGEEFSRLTKDTIETMAVLTDSTEMLDKLDEYEEEGGGYNMCLAVEEMRRDWKAEGIVEVGLDCGLSENDIVEKLQEKLNVSLQKAQEYLSLFGKKMI